jgi:hypothetical protein
MLASSFRERMGREIRRVETWQHDNMTVPCNVRGVREWQWQCTYTSVGKHWSFSALRLMYVTSRRNCVFGLLSNLPVSSCVVSTYAILTYRLHSAVMHKNIICALSSMNFLGEAKHMRSYYTWYNSRTHNTVLLSGGTILKYFRQVWA